MTIEEQRAKRREYMKQYNARKKDASQINNKVVEPERHPIYFANDTTPKQRVEQELSNIQQMYIKLCAFTSGDNFKTLSKAHQQLLLAQRQIQSSYIEILKARLQIWE